MLRPLPRNNASQSHSFSTSFHEARLLSMAVAATGFGHGDHCKGFRGVALTNCVDLSGLRPEAAPSAAARSSAPARPPDRSARRRSTICQTRLMPAPSASASLLDVMPGRSPTIRGASSSRGPSAPAETQRGRPDGADPSGVAQVRQRAATYGWASDCCRRRPQACSHGHPAPRTLAAAEPHREQGAVERRASRAFGR
jgi:hypothetical protein